VDEDMKILIEVTDVQNTIEKAVGCAVWLVKAGATAVFGADHGGRCDLKIWVEPKHAPINELWASCSPD